MKEAWKNGASVNEIQKTYDENLSRIKKLEPVNDLWDTAIIPEVIKDFLHKTGLKPVNTVNLSNNYKNVVIAKEKFRGLFNFDAWIYMSVFDEVNKSIIKDFGTIAYKEHNYSERLGLVDDSMRIEHKESVFTIFLQKTN